MNKMPENEKGFSLVEVIIVIVVIALIGAVGWVTYKNHQKTTPTTTAVVNANKSNTAIKSSDPDTAQIISGVEEALATQYTISKGTFSNGGVSDPPNSNTLTVNSAPDGPIMSVAGYSFSLSPSQGTTLNIRAYQAPNGPLPNISNIISLVSTEFGKLKLVNIPGATTDYGGANYQNATAYCSFNDDTNTQDQPYPFSISCANKSVYPVEAAAMQPLVNVLEQNDPTLANQKIFVADLTIGNSQTPGYKYATMGVVESKAFFYQKNGTWYYYAEGQDGLSCNFTTNTDASLNNNDARLAFLGQACTNSDGSSGTVQ